MGTRGAKEEVWLEKKVARRWQQDSKRSSKLQVSETYRLHKFFDCCNPDTPVLCSAAACSSKRYAQDSRINVWQAGTE
jgi:hypothetical protein